MKTYKIVMISSFILILLTAIIGVKKINFEKDNIPEKVALNFLTEVFSGKFIFEKDYSCINDYIISSTESDLKKVSDFFSLESDKLKVNELFNKLLVNEELSDLKTNEFIKAYINMIEINFIEKSVSEKDKNKVVVKVEVLSPVLKEEVFSSISTDIDLIIKESSTKEEAYLKMSTIVDNLIEDLKKKENIETEILSVTLINTKKGFKILSVIS